MSHTSLCRLSSAAVYALKMFSVLGGQGGICVVSLCVFSAWHTVGVNVYLLTAYLNGLLHQVKQLCKPCWLCCQGKARWMTFTTKP